MKLYRHFLLVTVSVFFAICPVFANDDNYSKQSDEFCSDQYKRVDNFLQYLYKIDGNLADINPSKIKRIEYLEMIFDDSKSSMAQKRSAFGELFNDADWWVYKLQRNSRGMIGSYESIKKNSSWEAFKSLANQQAAGKISRYTISPSATKLMNETSDLIYKTTEYFSELTEITSQLEGMGAGAKLNKSFSSDNQKNTFEAKMFSRVPKYLLGCQIRYIEFLLSPKG